jgi:uncharacterized protein YcfL
MIILPTDTFVFLARFIIDCKGEDKVNSCEQKVVNKNAVKRNLSVTAAALITADISRDNSSALQGRKLQQWHSQRHMGVIKKKLSSKIL